MKVNKYYIKVNFKEGFLMIPSDEFKKDVGFFLEGSYEKINDFLKKKNY